MHLLTFFHHTPADAGPRFPDAGTEKGARASCGRKRQPTSSPAAAAVVSDTCPDLHLPPSRGPAEGRLVVGGREGCGEPRSDDDEPSQLAALLPDSLLLAPSVPSRPLHSHHHVLYRFGSFLSTRRSYILLQCDYNLFQRLLPSWQEMTSSKRR